MSNSDLEKQILEIKKKKSYEPFTNIFDEIQLKPVQSAELLCWLYQKKGVFTFDTGLGKTIIMISSMKLLKNKIPQARFLIIAKKAQLSQLMQEIKSLTNFSILWSNASATYIKNHLFTTYATKVDVIIITHESLSLSEMQQFLLATASTYTATYIDEAHNISNYAESNRAYYLAAFNSRQSHVASLTATPIITKPEQLTWLLYMTDKKLFERTDHLNRQLKSHKRIDDLFPLSIYNHDRESLGIANQYNPIMVEVEPHAFQYQKKPGVIYQTTRISGSKNQVDATIHILLQNKKKGKRGLLFLHYHESREYLIQYLQNTGIRFSQITGRTSAQNDKEAQEAFNKGDLDLLICSVREALNLDCDYVFVYEVTAYLKQSLGRSERGYTPKSIDVYFLFTKGVGEKEYFAKTILPVSYLVRDILGRDYQRFLPELGDLDLDGSGII